MPPGRRPAVADLAHTIGTVTILPPNGAWFVCDVYDDYPLALFSDELSARRWSDKHGYGYVVFWPFGKTWSEMQK